MSYSDYDLSTLYSGIYGNSLYGNSYSNYNTNNTSSLLNTVGSLLSGENGTTGNSSDLLTGMMIGLMCSSVTGSGSNLGTGSNSTTGTGDSFNIMLSSLLKAVNQRNQQAKQGLIQNNAANGTTNDDSISNVILRLQGTQSGTSATGSERINNAIESAASAYGVNENLIRAIIQVESNFNPEATSSAGAKGLMQLMPCNIRAYGVSDPYNIEENINAGTQYIKSCLDRYNNDLPMALAAYNYGVGNLASRSIRSSSDFYKLPDETKNYLSKISNILNA